ncbi:hypothetical protein [Vibrio agarivorans]|uniref:Uncharacterized protein n=1 Tax=Vibrio agarivorans TaxID=153622 RepID=A0ABT7Y788_9VIBR|nr:hypothetical protein [Vibrio agarivorans]MDN2483928.1 hypothetical protein [Vibrio agarivorans]
MSNIETKVLPEALEHAVKHVEFCWNAGFLGEDSLPNIFVRLKEYPEHHNIVVNRIQSITGVDCSGYLIS